jgi:hypothetical protein
VTDAKYRIVKGDNFDRAGEQPGCDESFMLWPISLENANSVAMILNEESSPSGTAYYRVVPLGYTLKKFEP